MVEPSGTLLYEHPLFLLGNGLPTPHFMESTHLDLATEGVLAGLEPGSDLTSSAGAPCAHAWTAV